MRERERERERERDSVVEWYSSATIDWAGQRFNPYTGDFSLAGLLPSLKISERGRRERGGNEEGDTWLELGGE